MPAKTNKWTVIKIETSEGSVDVTKDVKYAWIDDYRYRMEMDAARARSWWRRLWRRLFGLKN